MYTVGVVGLGYVGLPFSVFLAKKGFKVVGVDIDNGKISRLNKGDLYIKEDYLIESFKKYKNNINFTSSYKSLKDVDYVFICVGTPYHKRLGVNTTYLLSAIERIQKVCNSDTSLIIRSTIPPGTTKKIKESLNKDFKIAYMPEFLREGSSLMDIENPNKIVVGFDDEKSKNIILKLLYKLYPNNKFKYIITNTETAEFIKYSQNIFYALKISYINELQRISEYLSNKGLKIELEKVYENFKYARGVNPFGLKPGLGFSGPCLPKDLKGFYLFLKKKVGYASKLFKNVIKINKYSFDSFVNKTLKFIKYYNIKKLGILGLTYKPKTDDVRNSHSIYIIKKILKRGPKKLQLYLYDPMGLESAKEIFGYIKRLHFCKTLEECIKSSDGFIVLTEWEESKKLKSLKKPVLWGRYIL